LALDSTKVPLLANANSFTGDQTMTGKLNIATGNTEFPFSMQSSNALGTGLQLTNASAGGHSWQIFSAGSQQGPLAGSLTIRDNNSSSSMMYLLGNVTVSNTQQALIGDMGCGVNYSGVGFGLNANSGCFNYSVLGGDGNTYINRPIGGSILFRQGNGSEMVLAPGGLLGLGTLTPQYQLHATGSIRSESGLSLGGNALVSVDAPGVAAGRLTVQANGNVGINNPNPQTTLDVAGVVKSTNLGIGGDAPMSHNPRMVFSGFLPGDAGNVQTGSYFVPDQNIIITRVSAGSANPGSGCSTSARLWVTVEGLPQVSMAMPGGLNRFDSGPVSVSVSAGQSIVILGVPASGCGVFEGDPSNVFVNVQYVMQ
jgi:hypothetical protein